MFPYQLFLHLEQSCIVHKLKTMHDMAFNRAVFKDEITHSIILTSENKK